MTLDNIATPVLKIDDLRVALPEGADRGLAVDGVSLSISHGRTLCVVGESGSGKSVLANAVMGLLPNGLRLQGGSIRLDGEELIGQPERALRKLRARRMGMVFQEPMTALNPVMRCGEQLDEVLRLHTGWSRAQRTARVHEVMEQVRLPDVRRLCASYPHQLSGGQRQRIVIAMAVLLKPQLLICDEPTTALDVTTQKEILKLIADLHRSQGSAVLFITHDMGVVDEIADDILVMRAGVPVEYGAKADVLERPQAPYTRDLLAAVPALQPRAPRTIPPAAALIRAVDVEKRYVGHGWAGRTEHVALTGAALDLRAGETVGVVGESGSGKSTFARCLIRLIDPTGGTIEWGGTPVQALPERRLRPLRSRVQVVFQDPNRSLNPRCRIGESIMEGARNFGASREDARQQALELLSLVRLPEAAFDRYPNEFSGGQRQRIAIARALACRPDVLIADEAVSALDVSVQAQILKLLREVQAEFGLGILFITHDLRVAAQLCDRVLVMHRGRVVEQGATGDVYLRPTHDYTRTLLACAPGYAVLRRDAPSPAQPRSSLDSVHH